MTDVFISYSRKDIDFARQLFDALEAAGLSSWVDFDDIPYSVDWMLEIEKGIDASDAYVFIISPDSVASRVCNLELTYARQNSKRIIPVVRRDVDAGASELVWQGQDWGAPARENWTHLRRLNWLFARANDNFDLAFQSLVEVAQQDPEHVRAHTRLLTRAREWDVNQRDGSYLLSGEDLKAAESWLVTAANLDPQPTPLQIDYIQTSRQRQTQRTRNLLIGVSIALVVTVALAALSFGLFQRSETNRVLAENNEATAVYQGTVSEALRLSAQAELEASGPYPDRGVLLALEVLDHYPYVWQAERALATAVQSTRLRFLVEDDPGFSIHGVSAQHRFLSTTSVAGYTETPEPERPCQPPLAYAYSVDGWPMSTFHVWALEADQQLLDWTGCALLWSPANPARVAFVDPSVTTVRDLGGETPINVITGFAIAWSPSGDQLAVRVGDQLQIWEVEARRQRFTITGHVPLWSPDGRRILTLDNLSLWDANTGAQLLTLVMPSPFADITQQGFMSAAWSPDSRQILGTQLMQAARFDASTGERLEDIPLGGDMHPGYKVLWIDEQPLIANTVGTTGLLDITLDDLSGDDAISVSQMANNPQWSINGELASSAVHNTVRIDTGSIDGSYEELHLYGGPYAATYALNTVWAVDSAYVAASIDTLFIPALDSKALIHVWDAGSRARPLPPDVEPEPGARPYLATDIVSPDGGLIYRYDPSTEATRTLIAIHDSRDNRLLQTLHLDDRYGGPTIEWSSDGRYLSAHATGGPFSLPSRSWVWDVRTGEQVLTFTNAYSIQWAPHANRLLVAPGSRAEIWDVERRILLYETDAPTTLAEWSNDGERLIFMTYAWVVRDGVGSNEYSGVTVPAWETLDDLMAYARDCCVVRSLSADERRQFGLPSFE
ncbi:MAG: TIR domain-containing protein [Anaerolineae bacterium]|nr:TIR domain-containing protein [Anaerolineae bacterium]